MRLKIKNGVFNIVNRLKKIDKSYYLVFNTETIKYEVHSNKQKNSFCFAYDFCDERMIRYAKKSSVKNLSNLLEEIALNNEQIELNSKKQQKDYIKFHALNLMEFISNSSKNANFSQFSFFGRLK